MRFSRFETEWEAIPTGIREELVLTGNAAYDVLSGTPPDEVDSITAYADRYLDVPEYGDARQVLTVLYVDDASEDYPSSVPYGETNVADMDVVVDDMIDNNVRTFRRRVRSDGTFRDVLRRNLSGEKKHELAERFVEEEYDPEIADELRALVDGGTGEDPADLLYGE